jgi:predicted RNA-binding protein with PIN domain
MTIWLVDGHNLIGQLQDLSLDDPFDEAKLSLAVKSYCMRDAKSKATIIFDNGMPGGFAPHLSNSQVRVEFAPARTSADDILMRRAREQCGQRGFVLVTSDRRIVQLCYAYGIETLSSEEFALLIGFRPVEPDPEEEAATDKKNVDPTRIRVVYAKDPNPMVSKGEIAYWLPIFERKLQIARAARVKAKMEAAAEEERAREARKTAREEAKKRQKQKRG